MQCRHRSGQRSGFAQGAPAGRVLQRPALPLITTACTSSPASVHSSLRPGAAAGRWPSFNHRISTGTQRNGANTQEPHMYNTATYIFTRIASFGIACSLTLAMLLSINMLATSDTTAHAMAAAPSLNAATATVQV
jgi:hypothetical protein